jgi:hypothetical protein
MMRSMALPAALLFSGLSLAGVARAEVSAEEAKALGTALTLWGAEKAGNADGSIPAYTGGNSTPPASYQAGSGRYPDPYADEKPLFTIDAKNLASYASKLTDGTREMLQRWPDYRLDVYPTHRSATYPKFAAENSLANATRAKIVQGDMGVEGAYGGIPFPIPKSGIEVVWNHFLRYMPLALNGYWPTILVDAAGGRTHIASIDVYYETPYYDPDKKSLDSPIYQRLGTQFIEPARSSGERTLLWYSIDFTQRDALVWNYTPGQRRVRLAPEARYDTPAANYGGTIFYDEIAMYSAPPDHFVWKLLGKKEIYVPYNAYRVVFDPIDQVFGPKHIDPDELRWELHRVWVVEGTVKPGKRHAYSKRVFYVDEDTWYIVISEGYDHEGKLYRVGQGYPLQAYDPEHPFTYTNSYVIYDLIKGTYTFFDCLNDPKAYLRVVEKRPPYATTPDAMAGSGLR